MTLGDCRLCGQVRPLVNSHVVPRFLCKSLKINGGSYYVMSSNPATPERHGQKDVVEPLFCGDCDTVTLQRYEDHLARFLGSGPGAVTLTIREETSVSAIVTGYDYLKLKNALLSVLWRMSLSRHELFKKVQLGPKHTEALRVILLNGETPPEDRYGVSFTVPQIEGKHYPDFLSAPSPSRSGVNRIYRCVIAGILYTFEIGSGPLSEPFQALTIRKAGWRVLKIEIETIPFLRAMIGKMAEAERGRKSARQ
jgi:hypothetical protein